MSTHRRQLDRVVADSAAAGEIASAIESCSAALASPELRAVRSSLQAQGVTDAECVTIVEEVAKSPESARRVHALRTALREIPPAGLERYLLLQTLTAYRSRVAAHVMGDAILRCLADELHFLAQPSERDSAQLLAPTHGFISMAKVVTLRRFPAGQLHIERSGIPRSWLARLGPRELARVLIFLARRVGGLGPFFFHHLAWRRKNRFLILEGEQNRSYFRIAQSLALHPDVRGLATESWLHSPETFRVSPHLAWLNRPFHEHGGVVVIIGAASESSGVFTGSAERKRLYDEGQFRPTTALVIWPRAALLDWAANHPEYAD